MGKVETSDRESVILKRKLISNSWCDWDLFFKGNHGKFKEEITSEVFWNGRALHYYFPAENNGIVRVKCFFADLVEIHHYLVNTF